MGEHAARFAGGAPGVLHGTKSYLLQDADGQVALTHSVSAGLDYATVGPEHAWLHDRERAEYTSSSDAEALAAAVKLARTEGIIPALESAHAVAEVIKRAPAARVNCSSSTSLAAATRIPTSIARTCRNWMPTRIQTRFRALKEQKRAALIAYVTAGDPSPERTPEIVAALERGGVDLIELGVPFSDPIADGPVIQRASDRALKAGTTLPKVLDIARRIRKTSADPAPVVHLFESGAALWARSPGRDAKAAGIDGCLLTDLSVEEAEPYVNAMRAGGLDTVFLAAPTSTPERLKLVAQYSTGFVYLVSRTGVTGERASLSDSFAPLIATMRAVTKLPLAAGFGISTPEQAAVVAKMADGVVVGSAFVRLIERQASDAEIEAFTRSLRQGMDRQGPYQGPYQGLDQRDANR